MIHMHKTTGMKFECGELVEIGVDKTFDITMITYWPSNGYEPPIVVGYYFGEYDPEATDFYIDEWLLKRAKDTVWVEFLVDAHDIVEAYHITNVDVLEEPMRSKVARTLTILKSTLRAAFED